MATLKQAIDTDEMRKKLAQVAGNLLNPTRLVRLLLIAANRDSDIAKCDQMSVIEFAMRCAETGLEPIGAGGCWPIPYGSKLTFIPDYRGLINVAKRAGLISGAKAYLVFKGDIFEYSLGLNPDITHRPKVHREEGDWRPTHAYCVVSFPDGRKEFDVMTYAEIEAIRKRSKAAAKGPWVTDWNEMAKKSIIRRAMKLFAGSHPEFTSVLEDFDAGDPVEEREPVAMPRAIDEPAEAPDEPESTEEPQEESDAKQGELPLQGEDNNAQRL